MLLFVVFMCLLFSVFFFHADVLSFFFHLYVYMAMSALVLIVKLGFVKSVEFCGEGRGTGMLIRLCSFVIVSFKSGIQHIQKFIMSSVVLTCFTSSSKC